MTGNSRCRDIERLILEHEERTPGEPEARLVAGHLAGCARCRSFEAARAGMREGMRGIDWPTLPPSLDRRTRRSAGEALGFVERPDARRGGKVPLPWPVMAALGIIVVLTGIWSAATLADIEPGQALADLPLAAKAALLLIAQNVFVLLFAPVILRAVRPPSNGHHGLS